MNPIAALVVRLTLITLPPGTTRDRYAAELRADLWGQPGRAQVRQALSLLRHSGSLRKALLETGAIPFPHSPAWCRMRLHHTWRTMRTEDNQRYRRCRACGVDEDGSGQVDENTVSFGAGVVLQRPH